MRGAALSASAALLAACAGASPTPPPPASASPPPASASPPPSSAPSPSSAPPPQSPAAASPPSAAPTASPAATPASSSTAAPASGTPAADTSPTSAVTPTVVYTSLTGSLPTTLASDFERTHPGSAVKLQPLPSATDAQARILAERGSPRADLLLGGSSDLHAALAKEGLLETYRSAATDALPAALRDPAGAWTGWYADVLALLVNRDRYRGDLAGVEAPQDWDGLLRPEFKGKLALPDPAATDAGYLFLAGQLFRLGRDEARALDYMKQLHPSISLYAQSDAALTAAVAKGQAVLGVGWAREALAAADRGEPVVMPAPPDLLFDLGAVSLIKGGPNPTGARALIDWLLGKEASQLLVSLADLTPALKGVDPPAGLTPLDGSPQAPYDRRWAAENRARLITAWRIAVGRS